MDKKIEKQVADEKMLEMFEAFEKDWPLDITLSNAKKTNFPSLLSISNYICLEKIRMALETLANNKKKGK
jgi:hypothetical protein